MLQLLKDQTACALTHDETITAGTEWTTGFLGLVITSGEGVHGVETAYTCLTDSCLGTTSHNHVSFAQTNQVEGVSQCV